MKELPLEDGLACFVLPLGISLIYLKKITDPYMVGSVTDRQALQPYRKENSQYRDNHYLGCLDTGVDWP